MSLIKRILFSALLAPLLTGGGAFAAEFEVLDRFSVDGYSVLRGSADIPGGSFAVGGSTFVVKDGKVGIGTDSPGSLLSLYSAGANPTLKITDASGAGIRGALLSGSWGGNGAYLDSLASAGWVYLGSSPGGGQANQVVAYTAGTERIRIDSYGNVGIGTSNPAGKFEAMVEATPASTAITDSANYSGAFYISRNSNLGKHALIFKGAGHTAAIESGRQAESLNWLTYLAFDTYVSGTDVSALSETMRITGGNVGIGTTGPGEKLV